MSNVAQLVDTRNLTLEWPRGAGRVENYSVRIWPRDPDEVSPPGLPRRGLTSLLELVPLRCFEKHMCRVRKGEARSARELTVQAPAPGTTARVLLGGLAPGAGYSLSIAAHSYNLTSDLFTMDTRTSEYPPRGVLVLYVM